MSAPEVVELKTGKAPVLPKAILLPFVLVTCLFSLWGFANDITNPMVAAFKNILLISNFESSLVQFAFYGGYCVMAIPAALFIKRYTFKSGIVFGLLLYAVGCLMFIPAGWVMAYWLFLLSYFVMTCGLSFLETSCNPYVLMMGPDETSTRRLNFAQSFNPMGSIMGMFVASMVILPNINPMSESGRRMIRSLSEGGLFHAQIEKSVEGDLASLMADDKGMADRRLLSKMDDVLVNFSLLNPDIAARAAAARPVLVRHRAPQEEVNAAKKTLNGNSVFLNKKTGEILRPMLDVSTLIHEENVTLQAEHAPVLEKNRAAVVSAQEKLMAARAELESSLKSGKANPASMAAVKAQLQGCVSDLKNAEAAWSVIPAALISNLSREAGARLHDMGRADLKVIVGPYALLGLVVLIMFAVFLAVKLPADHGEGSRKLDVGPTFRRLVTNAKYVEGVIAQAFYVGVQIMVWTFIIQYAENELGMEKSVAQTYNIVAMSIFVTSRFICTYLLKYFSPGGLLLSLALGGFALTLGAIFVQGYPGLYCLVGISACMSLMFPTIYGIALKGLGDDAKLGAAGLIMAIGGGCLMPPMQGWIMDQNALQIGSMVLSSTRASFFLPLLCFVVIAIFGYRTSAVHRHTY